MQWRFPLDSSQITEKQLLTKDKPITRIHEAVHEIQSVAITELEIDIPGLKITHAYARDNTFTIRGVAVAGLENKLRIIGDNLVLDSKIIMGDMSEIAAPRQTVPIEICTPTGGA